MKPEENKENEYLYQRGKQSVEKGADFTRSSSTTEKDFMEILGPEDIHLQKQNIFKEIDRILGSKIKSPEFLMEVDLRGLGVDVSVEEAETMNDLVLQYQKILTDEIIFLRKYHEEDGETEQRIERLNNEMSSLSRLWDTNLEFIKDLKHKREYEIEVSYFQDIYEGRRPLPASPQDLPKEVRDILQGAYNKKSFDLETDSIIAREIFEREIFPRMREAKPKDYRDWLDEFIQNDGKIGNWKDTQMPTDNWFVAERDFRLIRLNGIDAISIIVPRGIRYLGGSFGDSNLYFMEEGKHHGSRLVDVFSNTTHHGYKKADNS